MVHLHVLSNSGWAEANLHGLRVQRRPLSFGNMRADVGQGDGWEDVDLELNCVLCARRCAPAKGADWWRIDCRRSSGQSTYRRRVQKGEHTEEIGSSTATRTIAFEVPDRMGGPSGRREIVRCKYILSDLGGVDRTRVNKDEVFRLLPILN
jgi:hypothetical protein